MEEETYSLAERPEPQWKDPQEERHDEIVALLTEISEAVRNIRSAVLVMLFLVLIGMFKFFKWLLIQSYTVLVFL